MFRDIKIIEYYCTKNPNLKEIMYDADGEIDVGLYSEHMNFVHDNMRMFQSRNYSEEKNVERYNGNAWNYNLKYTNREDVNDTFKLRFEISNTIFPTQEHDPFRYVDENMNGFYSDWWMYLTIVNGIWCYTFPQASKVIEVLTGITDKPWHYEE